MIAPESSQPLLGDKIPTRWSRTRCAARSSTGYSWSSTGMHVTRPIDKLRANSRWRNVVVFFYREPGPADA
jgi:hypothetical protein